MVDRDFILKRISEQKAYIDKIVYGPASPRKEEILASARGQLEYFEKKLADLQKVKYRGVWTPKYMAEYLLFPDSANIQNAEGQLEAWAWDIVEMNQRN